MKNNVVVIVPTYNEQESIEDTLLSLENVFSEIKSHNMNILVFDSSSTDNTQHIVEKIQQTFKNITLITEPTKTGLGSAYIKAMKYAINVLKADIVFQFDADGSHQPKYIPNMLELLEKSDVVVGSRYIIGGSIPSNWAFYRKLLSSVGNLIIRLFLTRQYTDFTSGFRAIRAKSLHKINLDHSFSKNYAFLLSLTWSLHKAGEIIKEFPIEFLDREKGYSKLPISNIIESLKVVFSLRLLEIKNSLSLRRQKVTQSS